MELKVFVSYYDVYKKDISFKESLLCIKFIFRKYRRDVILSFLGYISKRIGVVYTQESLLKIQEDFGISSNGLGINPRSTLILFQIFYDTTIFNEESSDEVLLNDHVSLLFLYSNQILNKTDFEKGKDGPSEVNIQLLMSMMKLYVGSINAYEINLMEEYYLLFYEKLAETNKVEEYNKILFKHTGMDIHMFIQVLIEMKEFKRIDSPFDLFDKFAVLKYEDIYDKWNKRIPLLPIPTEYRFLEQYPLIKKDSLYYGVPPLNTFLSLIRKPYHVLSDDVDTKDTFRGFWGTKIVEPIIKQYIKDIFTSDNVRVVDIDFQKKLGVEPADIVMVKDEDIFLLEIKSGYLGLADRYSQDPVIFKREFDKKYVYNTSGKHQLINQLDIFESKYDKIISLLEVDKTKYYKVFSCSVVFDESLQMFGFKRYLGNIFNDNIKTKIKGFKKFLPFLFSNLITFSELLSFGRRVNDVNKRIQLFKYSFNYQDSMSDFFNELKDHQISMEGIAPEDIS